MRFKVVFCSKRMKAIQTIKKLPLFLETVSHNNVDNFATAK